MDFLLIGAATAIASGLLYNSGLEEQKETMKETTTEACQKEIIEDVIEEGDVDNLTRMQTVYKDAGMASLNCSIDDIDTVAYEQGRLPFVKQGTGYSRVEAEDPYTLRPPKRSINRLQEFYTPISNDNWSTAPKNGTERARDRHLDNCAPENTFNSTEGAYNDYTPFDFDENGKFVGRTGVGRGQYQTIRRGANDGDHLRFAYIGTERLRGLYTHSLRPAGGNQNSGIGNALSRWWQVRQGGATHKRYEMGEWTRPPVQQQGFGGKHHQAVILDPDLRHTNRQPCATDCDKSKSSSSWLHEELLAK